MNEVLSIEYQSMVANALCHAAEMTQENIRMIFAEHARPCVVFKPKLSLDGDHWIALFGDNFQEGVVGVGKSPELAMRDFDREWCKQVEQS